MEDVEAISAQLRALRDIEDIKSDLLWVLTFSNHSDVSERVIEFFHQRFQEEGPSLCFHGRHSFWFSTTMRG